MKGTQVYVEANYEIREGDTSADPSSPSAQRQVFLRHGGCIFNAYAPVIDLHDVVETLRVLKRPYNNPDSESSDHDSSDSS